MSGTVRVHILSITIIVVFIATACHFMHSPIMISGRMKYFGSGRPADIVEVVRPGASNGRAIAIIVSRSWKSGSANIDLRDFPLLNPLLRNGYTLFFVSHRPFPAASLRDIVVDIHRAIRFIRFNMPRYGLHSGKLGVLGVSSGGHLALMLATAGSLGDEMSPDAVEREPSTVQAVVAISPVSDLPALIAGKKMPFPLRLVDFWNLFAFSPMYSIHADMPPTLVFHGDMDSVVPIRQSLRYADAANNTGSYVVLDVLRGQRHKVQSNEHMVTRILQWYDTELR